MSTPDLKSSLKKELPVCSFYLYRKIKKDLKPLRLFLLDKGQKAGVRGLILLSKEGLNFTLTGANLKKYLKQIEKKLGFSIDGKWQKTRKQGFKSLRIKIKNEIIKTGKNHLRPAEGQSRLHPEKWQSFLKNKKPLIIDVRNDYEVELGSFKGAHHLNLKNFQEFSKKLKKGKFSKDKDTLIYCTGGVRCEKALSEMRLQGFKKVFQLKGGILNYLKHFPNSYFKGECFVFDHRVSLDQNLKPSQNHSLCPHCGQPGQKKTACVHCLDVCVVCRLCFEKNLKTCSKNCEYHHRMGHRSRKKEAKRLFNRAANTRH